MGGRPLKADIMAYFDKKPGQTVYLKDIATDLKLTEVQVQSAISGIIREEMMPLEVVMRGRAWCYRPQPGRNGAKPGNLVFEAIGKTREGDLVLQGEDSSLWKATQL